MIRIEDGFEDVLGKACAGLCISRSALAERSGVELARIESLLAGRLARRLKAAAP